MTPPDSPFDTNHLAMPNWGRHAIEELTGTFAAGRMPVPGSNPDLSIVSGPKKRIVADTLFQAEFAERYGLIEDPADLDPLLP